MAHSPPCSLTDQALEQRMQKWGSLRSAWLGSERTATGAIVRYRLDPWVAQSLLELLEAEGRCCPTLSFEATVTVRIEAPESMRAWVASTFAHDSQPVAPDADQPGVDVGAVREAVRVHYAAAARRAAGVEPGEPRDPEVTGVGANAYDPGELEGLPAHAVGSSIGCANPVAVADLRAGDIVVDLGSGGGTDVLLSARRVGPTGRAYGLDMTDEMLELARKNQTDAGIDNAEFLPGRIEDISPARRQRRRRAVQLRYRPLARQGCRLRSDVPRPSPWWAPRDRRHRDASRGVSGAASRRRELGLLPGRRPDPFPVSRRARSCWVCRCLLGEKPLGG